MSDHNVRFKSSVDGIEPAEGARERMLANIKRKAEAQATAKAEAEAPSAKAKIIPIKRIIKWALPVAACFVIAIIGVKVMPNVINPSTTQDPVVELANPFLPVENASAISEQLGIEIDAPMGAENVEYTICDGEMANIYFEYDGNSYTLRASRQSGDFSGLNGTPAGAEIIDAQNDAVLEAVRSGDEIYRKITWTNGEVTFILINTDGTDEETMKQLYEAIK